MVLMASRDPSIRRSIAQILALLIKEEAEEVFESFTDTTGIKKEGVVLKKTASIIQRMVEHAKRHT